LIAVADLLYFLVRAGQLAPDGGFGGGPSPVDHDAERNRA
jgi:hypothetical protein